MKRFRKEFYDSFSLSDYTAKQNSSHNL